MVMYRFVLVLLFESVRVVLWSFVMVWIKERLSLKFLFWCVFLF